MRPKPRCVEGNPEILQRSAEGARLMDSELQHSVRGSVPNGRSHCVRIPLHRCPAPSSTLDPGVDLQQRLRCSC
jgi:hypothetical protein